MDWMATLATAIAVLRLCLICGGMWMLLRSSAKPGVFLDYQRKCFTVAGVIYLLGLLPQSLLLMLMNSDLVNLVLDNGYLCLAQNLACMVAAALHSAVFLNWIGECICYRQQEGDNSIASLVKRKSVKYFLVLYVIVFILARNFFLRRDDMKRFYTDVAAKTSDVEVPHWTMSPMDNPSQVVRLQLLLCESSLCEKHVWNFLLLSYSFLLLPLPSLYFALKPLLTHRKPYSSPSTSDIDGFDKGDQQQQPQQQRVWWEQEINIQRLLSTSITIWFHLIEPIIFTMHREHFVDFGTHLLLTICIFIPWTHSKRDYNPLQSWV